MTTDKDLLALHHIQAHLSENRYAISLRELAERLGNTSSAPAHHRAHRLRLMGLVSFYDGDRRTLHLTDAGIETLNLHLNTNVCSCKLRCEDGLDSRACDAESVAHHLKQQEVDMNDCTPRHPSESMQGGVCVG